MNREYEFFRGIENIVCENDLDMHNEFYGCGEDALLEKIQKLHFAVYEANLYLNTHPCDRAAMRYYEKNQREYEIAVKIYEKRFGPITAAGADFEKNNWSWIEQPWPWQMEV